MPPPAAGGRHEVSSSSHVGLVELFYTGIQAKLAAAKSQLARLFQRVALIPSEELCDLITLRLIEKKEKSSKAKINCIIEELRALAIQVEDKEDVNTRYTMRNDCLYINRGSGNRQIKITKDKKNGIQCVKGRRIKFRGSKYISELDYQPEAKADFSHFWKYVPVSNKNSQLLLTAYMVNACFPDHECPILHIEGPPGSGKTTTTECILEIIDPTSFGVAAPLTSPEDITLAAISPARTSI